MNNQGKNKIVLFLIAGIPVAIGTWIIELCQFGNFTTAIIVGIMGFLIFGGCLSVLAQALLKSPKPKNKAFELFVLAFVGCVISAAFYIAVQLVPTQKWIGISSSPEKPVSIVHTGLWYGSGVIIVESESGTTYRYNCLYTPTACAWISTEQLPPQSENNIPSYVGRQRRLLYFSPVFPGRVIDSYQVIEMAGSSGDFWSLKLVLREDGRLFYWKRSLDWLDTYPIYFIGYLLSSFAASLSIFRALHPRRQRAETTSLVPIKNHEVKESIRKVMLFLLPGLIAGSAAGWINYGMFQDLVTAICVGLGGCLLTGGVFSVLGIIWSKSRESGSINRVLRSWLCVTAGFVLIQAYYYSSQYAPVGKWVPMTAPPEAVVHILPSEVDPGTGWGLYVKSKSSTVYMYSCIMEEGYPRKVKECKWEQTMYLLSGEECRLELPQSERDKYFSPITPAGVVESWQSICGDYRTLDTFRESGFKVLLMEDGRLLSWNRTIHINRSRWHQTGYALFGILAALAANKIMKSTWREENK
jgi:hypothetical protein